MLALDVILAFILFTGTLESLCTQVQLRADSFKIWFTFVVYEDRLLFNSNVYTFNFFLFCFSRASAGSLRIPPTPHLSPPLARALWMQGRHACWFYGRPARGSPETSPRGILFLELEKLWNNCALPSGAMNPHYVTHRGHTSLPGACQWF